MSLLIRNIKGLVQTEETPREKVSGADMARLPVLENAWLLVEGDVIRDFGDMAHCPERAERVIDAEGRFVLPGWCDSHTHLVYAASREEEFVHRLKGMSYEEIARQGGGILNSARKMQAATEEQLLADALERLYEVIGYGTGAIEIKSGYGLTTESELKMLRVIRRLKEISPIPIKATFLGAHAMPAEFRDNREGYLKQLIDDMLPRVAGEGLAEYCDVFCDRGFYTVEETDRILKAAWKYGLKPKIHANELDYSGGVQVGVANQAVSVDHLEYCGEAEIEALSGSQTMPVALPSCSFFLNIPFAPGRKIIDAGLPLVLASDYNPGSTPSGKIPFVIALACIRMQLLPEEAINAVTLNGARAMELHQEYGSIARGKVANIQITKKIPSLAYIPYAFGSDHTDQIILNGKEWQRPTGNKNC